MDLDLTVGQDLVITENGDLNVVDGWVEVEQACLRLLMTNPKEELANGTRIYPDYVFDPAYGLGLRRLVGEPTDPSFQATFTQKIRLAILGQEGVDNSKDPIINFQQNAGQVIVQITVFLLNQTQKQISFPFR